MKWITTLLLLAAFVSVNVGCKAEGEIDDNDADASLKVDD